MPGFYFFLFLCVYNVIYTEKTQPAAGKRLLAASVSRTLAGEGEEEGQGDKAPLTAFSAYTGYLFRHLPQLAVCPYAWA